MCVCVLGGGGGVNAGEVLSPRCRVGRGRGDVGEWVVEKSLACAQINSVGTLRGARGSAGHNGRAAAANHESLYVLRVRVTPKKKI